MEIERQRPGRAEKQTERQRHTERDEKERKTDRHVEIERKRGREKASFYCLC